MNRNFLKTLLLTSLSFSCLSSSAEPFLNTETEESLFEKDVQKVSFYRGFLIYRTIIKKTDSPINFELVLEGMKEAHKNRDVPEDEEEMDSFEEKLQASIDKVEAIVLEKAKNERLEEANNFLSQIALKEGIVKLVPGKLYYQVLQKGNGLEVGKDDSPVLLYNVKTLSKGQEKEIHRTEEPQIISLKSTIAGFAQGVIGMHVGEKRILYIQPDLAYGSNSERVDPNSLMIFEVEAVKFN